MLKKFLLLMLIPLSSFITNAQKPENGDLIPDFGKTIPIESPDFKTDTLHDMKVVFDVGRSFEASEVNKLIETVARYLNMHEKAGVHPENMKVAIVVHGAAPNDLLLNEYYIQRFKDQTSNPNLPLLDALAKNDVQIIVCGQSATAKGINKEMVHKDVQFALSAMTALVQLQNDNYRLIAF
ncbi:DsrE family protein [Gramella sp. AN32]|uniref:DsrE family protein n=1 Tax=Christiangramia antarctica TaxID=2058158 RepID=A0ABW5X7W1_9FLAO|nr:DsrE family protein [Gramella sp. AN32]